MWDFSFDQEIIGCSRSVPGTEHGLVRMLSFSLMISADFPLYQPDPLKNSGRGRNWFLLMPDPSSMLAKISRESQIAVSPPYREALIGQRVAF